MAKNLEAVYPGFELYNDCVNLLREITQDVKPELMELIQKADGHWEDLDRDKLKYCQPLVDYFKGRYSKLYKYHPKLMVLMIIKERRIDMDVFVKFLRIRKEMSNGKLDEDQASREFGQNLFDKYGKPLVDMEKEKEKEK